MISANRIRTDNLEPRYVLEQDLLLVVVFLAKGQGHPSATFNSSHFRIFSATFGGLPAVHVPSKGRFQR